MLSLYNCTPLHQANIHHDPSLKQGPVSHQANIPQDTSLKQGPVSHPYKISEAGFHSLTTEKLSHVAQSVKEPGPSDCSRLYGLSDVHDEEDSFNCSGEVLTTSLRLEALKIQLGQANRPTTLCYGQSLLSSTSGLIPSNQ